MDFSMKILSFFTLSLSLLCVAFGFHTLAKVEFSQASRLKDKDMHIAFEHNAIYQESTIVKGLFGHGRLLTKTGIAFTIMGTLSLLVAVARREKVLFLLPLCILAVDIGLVIFGW
jgi:hypothetical protein